MKQILVPIGSAHHSLIVTGSEDTTVRILNPKDDLKALSVLRSHISSVRTLAVCPIGDAEASNFASDVLVFSAGGRAQMKVWRIMVKEQG